MTDVKNIWDYCPETGIFTYARTTSNRAREGLKCGSVVKGDVRLSYFGKKYNAMRTAIEIMTGVPVDESLVVVPIDGDRTNIIYSNLEVITRREMQIRAKVQKNNVSGCRGVFWNKDRSKYMATISDGGKNTIVAYTASFQDAVDARRDAERKYYR